MRRRHRRRAGLALLVLLSTPLQASASHVGPALLMSPSAVPEAEVVVPLRVEVHGPEESEAELKAWIGSRDRQASRTWNGSGWHRSDHYVRTVDLGPDGTWTGWVAVRPNPQGAGYPELVDRPDRTGIHVRARWPGSGQTRTASATVDTVEAGNVTWRTGRAGGAAYVGARRNGTWTGLAPVAPDPRLPPAPAEGYFRIPTPGPGGELLRLDAEGEVLGPVPDREPPPLRLVRAVPHAYGPAEPAEAVAVENVGDGPASLAGVCLEAEPGGRACLREGTLEAGERIRLARNASAYEAAAGDAARPYPAGPGGDLGLPDGHGIVRLTHLGAALDVLAYGNVTPPAAWSGPPLEGPRPGEVLRRDLPGSPEAAPSGEGWVGGTRLGQSRADPASFALEGPAWASVAPADSYDLAADLVRRAEEEILVEAYLLTSPSLARELAWALDRGVDVRVLVEGSPVGGRPPVEDRILGALARRGADVATLSSQPAFRARYPTLHAKALVVDDETVLVSTENLARSGFPPGGKEGNRGWVAAVRDPGLAGYLAGILEADMAPRPDVEEVVPSGARLPPRPVAPPPDPPPPVNASGATARPVVAPDTARDPETVRGLLDSARERIDVELLSLETRFDGRWNPYVEVLIEAARRGVQVRVLLDPTYADPATGRLENDAPRDALEALARREGLPLEVRLARGLDVEKVHTKGAVVDGEAVLVGSVNWVEPAITRNRELGLILEAPPAAERFQEAFLRDWRGSLPGAGVLPPAAPGPGPASMLAAAVLAGLAAARGRG